MLCAFVITEKCNISNCDIVLSQFSKKTNLVFVLFKVFKLSHADDNLKANLSIRIYRSFIICREMQWK